MDSNQFPLLSRREILTGLPVALAASQLSPHPANTASDEQPSLGSLFPMVESYAQTVQPAYSFLQKQWTDLEKWKESARAQYRQLLYYNPAPCDFAAKALNSYQKNGYKQKISSFKARRRFLFLPPS